MYPFSRVHLYPRIQMYPHSALQLANRLPVKLGPLPSPRPPSARQSANQTPPPSLCHTPSPRNTPSISAPVCRSNSAPKVMSYPIPYVYPS